MIPNGCKWYDHGNIRNYFAPTKIGDKEFDFMGVKLGTIKHRNGRFQWVVFAVRYRDDWPVKKMKQGAVPSLEEAKKIIEGHWS